MEQEYAYNLISHQDDVDQRDEEQQPFISVSGAKQLMTLLMERGYFHDASSNVVVVVDAASKITKETVHPTFSVEECNLIQTADSYTYYCTTTYLSNKLRRLLHDQGGRWNVMAAAQELKITETVVRKRILPLLLAQTESEIIAHGDEFMTISYLDDIVHKLCQSVKDMISIAEISRSVLHLPLQMTESLITERLSVGTPLLHIRTLDSGTRVLVTQTHLDKMKNDFIHVMSTVTQPIQLNTVCKQHGWQQTWIRNMINDTNGAMMTAGGGSWHGDTFIPDSYARQRKRIIIETFLTNGVVTDAQQFVLVSEGAATSTVTLTQLKDAILSEYPDAAVVLSHCIVHREKILRPLITAMEDVMVTENFLDLQMHIPADLLHVQQDAKTLLRDHVLSRQPLADRGMAALGREGGLFFSTGFIRHVKKEMLPALVTHHVELKVKQLDQEFGLENIMDAAKVKEEKRKSNNKKSSSKSSSTAAAINMTAAVEECTVPLVHIAQALTSQYPDLAVYWNKEEDHDNNDADNALLQLCEEAFHTAEHERESRDAIQVEIKRLVTARAMSTRTMSLAKSAAAVEQAFEASECFPTACYAIQMVQQCLKYVSEHAETSTISSALLDTIKMNVLHGYCADITYRMTQYALFRNAVDGEPFSFVAPGADRESLHPFYEAVNVALRRSPRIFLSCRMDQDDKKSEPLSRLRKLLPGSVGVALARQWMLLGSQCFQQSDGDLITRPGDFDAFVSHVEEHCLLVTGLPYKKLDKKTEKKFLFARREKLLNMLSIERDPIAVLELTMMILMQLVRNIMIVSSGSLSTINVVLELLKHERKVSPEVAETLSALAHALTEESLVNNLELVERVRACGLSTGKK